MCVTTRAEAKDGGGSKDVHASKIIWSILNWEESNMRSIAFVLATFAAIAPAAAEGWEEYNYPEYAFSVTFPANPKVETTTYQVAPTTARSRRTSIRFAKATRFSR
jgi:hypothetical protein